MKKITRKKSMSNKSNKSMLFGLIAVIVLVASYFLYRSLVQTATVAEIRENPISCTSNIATFIAQGTCGNNLVSLVEYSCTNIGGVKQIGGPSGCVHIIDAFAQAQKTCGQTCTQPTTSAQPSPSVLAPLPPSSPLPSATSAIPASCTSWFDGCNTCTVKDGKVGACTKMKCMGETKPAQCLAYNNTTTKPLPTSSSCSPEISKKQYRESCGVNGYNRIEFVCKADLNNLRTIKGNQACSTASQLDQLAAAECSNHCRVVSQPLPPAEEPKPTTPTTVNKPSYATCHKTCRTIAKRSFWQCTTSCLR